MHVLGKYGIYAGVASAMVFAALPVREVGASCSTTSGSFSRSTSKSETFGSSMMKSKYYFGASISGKDKTVAGTTADRLDANAQIYAEVRAFGRRKTIAKVQASAYSIYGKQASGALDVYAMGYNIYHYGLTQALNYSKFWDRTFFTASQWFTIGPIPVKVTEKVKGKIGFTLAGGPTTSGVGLDFEPSIKAYGSATVGVNVGVAGVGITGSLTFLEVGVPTNAQLHLSSNCLAWSLDVDAWLQSLKGSLKAWVKVKVGWYTKKYTKKIFSWSGFWRDWSIYYAAGSISLG